MRAIDRRLRRIEARLTPPNNPDDQRGESSLRDLIRRRCEKAGHPYVDLSPEFEGLSLTEIARAHLSKMREREVEPSLEALGGESATPG
jgi:hypothetical protein